MRCSFQTGVQSLAILLTVLVLFGSTLSADDAPSPAAAMRRLLESGRVPEQRLPTIIKMICERGNSGDLSFILSEVLKKDHWSEAVQAETLGWMVTAAKQRKVIPAAKTEEIVTLFDSKNPAILRQAVELAGVWKVTSADTALVELARKETTPIPLRQQALEALVSLDPAKAGTVLKDVVKSASTFEMRSMGAAVLAQVNVQDAAELTAEILKNAGPQDQPGTLLNAFLALKNGSTVLAGALTKTPPSKDVAKLLLRQMYSVGRTDAELNKVLSELAGINHSAPPPTPEQVQKIVAEVAKSGDALRGEAVFRRPELSCLNCHSVNQGGGNIGPDLSAIGVSSPVDYLVTSILDPDQAIKEAFTTKVIVTVDGRVHQGIVASRTNDSLVLRDATGKTVNVPLADIDDEIEGKSLMPKGLSNFMTHAEFLDLVAFLGELGKPGPYAIRSTQRMQRYRFLMNAEPGVLNQIPSPPLFLASVLDSENWHAIYAQANGQVPLSELTAKTGHDVVYLKGEINCSTPGAAEVQVKTSLPVTIWHNDKELGTGKSFPIELASGTQAIVLRVDTTGQKDATVQVEITKPAGSAAEFVVVDGP
ncbi:hypothetical protein [Planctomicrobium sp. SH527]|uniref:hypothetical protein n=1 Tax=Planctomicrobium sp. SH527 TaxID=3448123 RepID=UPI003F5B5580